MNEIINGFNDIIISLAQKNSITIPDFIKNSNEIQIKQDLDFINDLHFDSLVLITMVIEIESKFRIELPDDAISYDTLRSYKSLCDIILYLCKQGDNNGKIK